MDALEIFQDWKALVKRDHVKVFCTDSGGLSTLNQCTLHRIRLGRHGSPLALSGRRRFDCAHLHCFLTFSSLLFPSPPSSPPPHAQSMAPPLPDAEGCVQHRYVPRLGGHDLLLSEETIGFSHVRLCLDMAEKGRHVQEECVFDGCHERVGRGAT